MINKKHTAKKIVAACAVVLSTFAFTDPAGASSHMDAPLITLDPAANTTDVYAFRSTSNNQDRLTVALAVYPFEEPGIGPNKYNFDDDVRYEIHVATGADVAAGRSTITYTFEFETKYKNKNTIAQSYLGLVSDVNDANQNLTQRYKVTKKMRGSNGSVTLFDNIFVPPNNQGLVTPFYNQGDSGENRAKEGVDVSSSLDRYTSQTIAKNAAGYRVFAGQRDDGFYADIQSIFDLDFTFSGPNKPFDSQGGFNVHTIVLNIPVAELGGTQQVVGVYATTSRKRVRVLREDEQSDKQNDIKPDSFEFGQFVQVGRQGNPLFNEALVAIKDKDRYSQTEPTSDAAIFKNYALTPELAAILGLDPSLRTNRTDIAGIFIPDLIKVDLSTGPVRLAGGSNPGAAPDDAGFNRLGIFGGDVLHSTVQPGFFNNGTVPGGWPNGRRFGDDVVDIAVLALLSDLRDPVNPVLPPNSGAANVDKVTKNDIGYNKVFPYAATPLNGRSHAHH